MADERVFIVRVLCPYLRQYGCGVTPTDKMESEVHKIYLAWIENIR